MKQLIIAAILYMPLLIHAGNESGGIGAPIISAMNAKFDFQNIKSLKYVREDESSVKILVNHTDLEVNVTDSVLEDDSNLLDAIKASYDQNQWIKL